VRVLGKSPLSDFQDLRVERAQFLLHGGGLDLDAIAAEVAMWTAERCGRSCAKAWHAGARDLRADLR
jgi:hypothetical protein